MPQGSCYVPWQLGAKQMKVSVCAIIFFSDPSFYFAFDKIDGSCIDLCETFFLESIIVSSELVF